MLVEFRLPDLGEGIAEGEVVKWLVQEGDWVQEDQPLVEVQTDKATVEIPSPVAGRVKQRMAKEGDIVQVGAVLITIETESQDARAVQTAPADASAVASPGHAADGQAARPAEDGDGTGAEKRRVLAAPVVRKMAREMGIDLRQVTGSGPGGRILKADLQRFTEARNGRVIEWQQEKHERHAQQERYAQQESFAPVRDQHSAIGTQNMVEVEVERQPLRGIRRAMARRMALSMRTAAHCTGMDEVDVTELVALRRQMAEKAAEKGVKLTYLPFIIKAVISGLKAYPIMNASLDEEKEEILIKREYHIGIAVDTPEGLVVPVIHHADRLSLIQLAETIENLTQRAREGKLRMEDVQGGTFTISNIGALGGTFATPVINYPEVAILGVNRIQPKPVVRDDKIVIRQLMGLSLSFDHRVIDGATSARFTNHVARYLEQPSLLFMEMV
jgi:pyruvate dehydrogenase E2 component (dihydrolipoamide acetyltransferase)